MGRLVLMYSTFAIYKFFRKASNKQMNEQDFHLSLLSVTMKGSKYQKFIGAMKFKAILTLLVLKLFSIGDRSLIYDVVRGPPVGNAKFQLAISNHI